MDVLRRMLGLAVLLGGELAVAVTLHRLGALPWLQVGWDDPTTWLAVVAPEDAVMAALRLVALGATYWLMATTVAYTVARASRVPRAVRSVQWATLPAVRRVADRAVAVVVAGSSITVAVPGLAAAGLVVPPGVSAPSGLPGDPGGLPGEDGPGELPGDPSGLPGEAGSGELPGGPSGLPGEAGPAGAPPVVPGVPPGGAPPVPADQDGPRPATPAAPGLRQPALPAPAAGTAAHTVVDGDNLWSITAGTLGPDASDAEVHGPWRAVVEANRGRLRSGDPDLIYPGEQVVLPPRDRPAP